MTRMTLAALAVTVAAMGLTIDSGVSTASAAGPVCIPTFQTVEKKSWILRCRKTVALAQKGVALTQAGNAVCNTEPYWNFGPQVTAKHLPGNIQVRVEYKCGHVEG